MLIVGKAQRDNFIGGTVYCSTIVREEDEGNLN
jgi:hypothetical protein